ncbi:MAG: 16S rRNA (cytidine(1402)-2'-O)-methyltransferase [Ponticaulis sp.]|nr:16S rRNA (cytidine(1402)-2'-O)-methyltransferase [Ponticaulis sp.]
MTQLFRSVDLSPGLYVVATPIGNLRDVTLRALDTLASVDVVYAEDTRQTRRLLDAYGIETALKPYHDHNGAQMRPLIASAIEDGQSVALVSDAGTPLISDPGFKLVRELAEAGHFISPIPGASAAIAALCVSGLPTDTFTFAGFLPPKSGARQTRLKDFAEHKTTLILYETGPRLAETLVDISAVYGEDTPVVVARELTKLFETVTRNSVSGEIARLNGEATPKGEIVLMISLSGETEANASAQSIEDFLLERLPTLGAKGAAGEAARHFHKAKRDMYALAVKLQSDQKE